MNGFVLFSKQHITTLLLIFLIIFVLFYFKEFINKKKRVDITIRAILIISMLTVEFLLYGWLVHTNKWDWGDSLPLQLCGICMYLCCYSLITKNYKVYEIIYFWGLAGALQAVLTPDITYGFPHFKYIQFFVTHGGIILSIAYMTFVFKFTPTFRSLVRSYICLILIAIPIYLLDYVIKGNYLFLREKPTGANLLDFFGPWPFYLIVLGILLIPYFLILYLPHQISTLIRNKSNHTTKDTSID